MADNGWRDVVLLTLREAPSKKDPTKGYGLWIVMRVKPDGTVFNVTARSGQYYFMNSEKRLPKDGLSDWDLSDLKKDWDKVKVLMDRKNPPPVPAADAPEPEKPADDAVEDCPF